MHESGVGAQHGRESVVYYTGTSLGDGFGALSIVPPILCGALLSLPFGIAALVFAIRSRAALSEGDLAGAVKARRRSTMFCWISVAWALFMVILFLVMIA